MSWKPEPFIRKWDGYDHYHFIVFAYKVYSRTKSRENTYLSETFPHRRWRYVDREDMKGTVRSLFMIGKRNYVLDLDFDTFWQRLDPIDYRQYPTAYRRRIYKPADDAFWYHQHGVGYRSRMPKKGSAQKKAWTDTDVAHQDWRARKGFDRDKRKSRGWHRNCPRYIKQMCAQLRRQHVSRTIWKGDWDNYIEETNRDFIDPWMWD